MFEEAKNNVIALTEAVFDRAQTLMEVRQNDLDAMRLKIAQERDALLERHAALDERERLLVAREAGVKSVQELAAVRLAANKTMRGQLEDAEERLKAVKKELSDLKSKINNPSYAQAHKVNALQAEEQAEANMTRQA